MAGCCGAARHATTPAVDALFLPVGSSFVRELHDSSGNPIPDHKIVRVFDKKDALYPDVVAVLSSAFCGSPSTAPDPMLDWMATGRVEYPPEKLSSEPEEERKQFFRWQMDGAVRMGLSRGGVYALVATQGTATDSPGAGRVVGAAVTGPPNCPSMVDQGFCEVMSLLWALGMPPKCDRGDERTRMEEMDKAMKAMHRKVAPQKHLYLMAIATDPAVQGRGLGSALLRFACLLADADGVDLYLESAGRKNVGMYEQKGGFQVVHRMPLVAGKDGKWKFEHDGGFAGMLRKPGGVARADVVSESNQN